MDAFTDPTAVWLVQILGRSALYWALVVMWVQILKAPFTMLRKK